MAVALPTTAAGNILPEYAATSTNFQRTVQNIDGVMAPVFTSNIAYQRTDYLVQDGKKVAIVNTEIGGPMPMPMPGPGPSPERFGNIYLDASKTAALFTVAPPEGKSMGEAIADMVDEQIRIDLIARGIITA